MIKKNWDNIDSALPLVTGSTSWRFIEDFKSFQSCKGIFIFTKPSHEVMYVGFTFNNFIIDAIASAISEYKNSNSTLVKVLHTQFDKDAKLIANILIDKYSPINNTRKLTPKNRLTIKTN